MVQGLAAEQGNADAQDNLGVMYANGKGVPQDYKIAVKWFKLPAAYTPICGEILLPLMEMRVGAS